MGRKGMGCHFVFWAVVAIIVFGIFNINPLTGLIVVGCIAGIVLIVYITSREWR